MAPFLFYGEKIKKQDWPIEIRESFQYNISRN